MENLSQCVSQEGVIQSLRNFTGRTDVKLLDDLEVRRATDGVEGLTSIVIRVKATYCLPGGGRKLTKNFFVKAFPRSQLQLDVVERGRLFDKEIVFFKEVVPLLVEASGGKVGVPLPHCYRAVRDSGRDAIYLEDLDESGFKTPGRASHASGLDYDRCSLVMCALGRFHALTIATEKLILPSKSWVEAYPIFSRDSLFYDPEDAGEPAPILRKMVESSVDTLLKISSLMDGVPKRVEASGALRKVLDEYWPTLCRLVKPASHGLNVLSHGDCWLNNLLFRHDGGSSVDVKMIDMQIVRYCHPSIELLYFLNMCARRKFRERNFDGLIHQYYESLTEALGVVGYGPPPISLEKLKEDMRGVYKPFGVIMNSIFTPNLLLGDDFMPSDREMNPEELEELFDTNNASTLLTKFSSDPVFRTQMEEIIREVVEWAFPQEYSSDN